MGVPMVWPGAPIGRPRPQSSSAGSQSLWLIPPISGVRTSLFRSVGGRAREATIYQGMRCDSYNGVEVMRRYSNPPGSPGDLGEILTSPTRRNTIATESLLPAQQQRRLRQDEVALLIEDYVRGASVEELIGAFGVNRATVYAHLDRNAIHRPRGVGRLSAEQVQEAAGLYRSGHLVTAIALKFGVGEETVRRPLRRGVEPHPR